MYEGTNFLGWQIQAKGRTVQGDIEQALQSIYSKNITVLGSGRTDSGVHALGQVAHFDVETTMSNNQIIKALNSKLENDVWVSECERIDSNFHARFSARKREYIYRISKVFTPFERNTSWVLKWDVDIKKMNECVEILLGEHDFTSFCKATAEVDNKICTIFSANFKEERDKLFFHISANRFLQHMVRFLVGTMVEVGRGRYSIDDFTQFMNGGHPTLSVVRAPAHGLFLKKVSYEN